MAPRVTRIAATRAAARVLIEVLIGFSFRGATRCVVDEVNCRPRPPFQSRRLLKPRLKRSETLDSGCLEDSPLLGFGRFELQPERRRLRQYCEPVAIGVRQAAVSRARGPVLRPPG